MKRPFLPKAERAMRKFLRNQELLKRTMRKLKDKSTVGLERREAQGELVKLQMRQRALIDEAHDHLTNHLTDPNSDYQQSGASL